MYALLRIGNQCECQIIIHKILKMNRSGDERRRELAVKSR